MGVGDYSSSGTIEGLDPEFDRRLTALIESNPRLKAYGKRLLNDLYRSPHDQVAAINSVARRNGISIIDYSRGIPGKAAGVTLDASGNPIASKSLHGQGRAADFNWQSLTPEDRTYLHSNAGNYGLEFPASLRQSDPVHVQMLQSWNGTLPSGSSPQVPPVLQANFGRESGTDASGNAFKQQAVAQSDMLPETPLSSEQPQQPNAFKVPEGHRVRAINIAGPDDFGFMPRGARPYG